MKKMGLFVVAEGLPFRPRGRRRGLRVESLFLFLGTCYYCIYMVMYGGGAGWKYEQAETRSLLTGLRSSASCRLARYSDRQSTGMATDRLSSFDSFFFSFRVLDFWMVVVLWLWREGERSAGINARVLKLTKGTTLAGQWSEPGMRFGVCSAPRDNSQDGIRVV